MKSRALLFLFWIMAVPALWAAPNPIDDLFKQAQDAASAKKYDDAIALYERVFTEHADGSDHWFDAQINIAQCLAQKGDFAEAAKAVHLCLDGAPDLGAFDSAVGLAANILSAQDKNVDRANKFLAFQQSGATGGQVNPMDAVGYPSQPNRESALATFRQQAGDDAPAARFRAYTYLYTGKPMDALASFADAFRRNENPYDLRSAGIELVNVGLRAAQGNRVGLDKGMLFVIFGSKGPDGKAGTADDLPDPFAPYLKNIPSPGTGGMAEIPADDLAALKKMRDASLLYAGDPILPSDGVRRGALTALQRLNNALDGWGAPGQKEWYLRLALGIDCPPPDEFTAITYLTGAVYAVRGRGMNYGDIPSLWTEIATDCSTRHLDLPKHLPEVQKQFDGSLTELKKIQYPPVTTNAMKNPATF